MEDNKNQTTIVILLVLIIGLILGYLFGGNGMMGNRDFFFNDHMYEEMEEHMYGDEIIDLDGAMIHAMDEMMLGFRGKIGEEYEEVFLRSMIVHHIGGIKIAEELLENTDRPELIEFAENIITTNTSEVNTMKEWLNSWFKNNN